MSPGGCRRSLPTVTQSDDLEISIESRTLLSLLRLTCITSAGIILNIEYNNFYISNAREVPLEKDYGR